MKEQVKSRMEELLQSEIKARALAKSTSNSVLPPSSSTTSPSVAASTTGQASTATGSPSVTGGRPRDREEAKADVLFNMDTGEDWERRVL